jgi:hypothetical protein
MPEPGAHRLLGEPYRTTVREIGRSGASHVWRSVPLLTIASDLERHIGSGLVPAARGASDHRAVVLPVLLWLRSMR